MASRILDVHSSVIPGDVQSHVLFVDSAKRNHDKNTDPSKMVLEFEEPFTMVVGFEILDASIPNVMYSVEGYNNTFSLVFADDDDVFKSLESNAHLTEYMCKHPVTPGHVQAPQNSVVSTRIAFVSSGGTVVRPHSSTSIVMVTKIDGANVTQIPQSNGISLANDKYYVTFDDDTDRNKSDLSASPSSFVVNPETMTLYKFLDVTNDGTLRSSDDHLICELSRMDIYAEHGNYTICALCQHMNVLMTAGSTQNGLPNTTVSAASCTGDFDRTSKMMLNSTKPFIVNLMATTMHKQTGFVNVRTGCVSKIVLQTNLEMPLAFECTDGLWRIPSPGVCDLTGERYIILRCPELENTGSSFKTRTYDGVAIFKMVAAPNSISELRFDYQNLRQTILHPIGKIHRLTFKFECGNGRAYDFKGVDYQFLASVKTVCVPRIQRFEKSILNPYYDPADSTSVPVIRTTTAAEDDGLGDRWDQLDRMVAETYVVDDDDEEEDEDEEGEEVDEVDDDYDAEARASNTWNI